MGRVARGYSKVGKGREGARGGAGYREEPRYGPSSLPVTLQSTLYPTRQLRRGIIVHRELRPDTKYLYVDFFLRCSLMPCRSG